MLYYEQDKLFKNPKIKVMKKLRIIDGDLANTAKSTEQFSDKYESTTTSYEEIIGEISKFGEDHKTPLFDIVLIENFFLSDGGSYTYDPSIAENAQSSFNYDHSLAKSVCHLKFVVDLINKGTSLVVVVNSWNQGFDAFIYFAKDAFGKNFNFSYHDFGRIQSNETEFFFGDYGYTDQSGRKNDTKKWEEVLERLPKWLVD